MNDHEPTQWLGWRSLAREPVVHFFILGALLFAGSQFRSDESRRILVHPGVRADLNRRFQDEHGRPPSPAEQAASLATWKRSEALYREALRKNLHLNDATIRGVLVDKMRAEAALVHEPPVPTDADLEAWLAAHPDRYVLPSRYDYQFLSFPKSEADFEAQQSKALAALAAGERPSALGRPLRAGNLTEQDLSTRVPPLLAKRIVALPVGGWERVESETEIWLVRLRRKSGGLPKLEDVRARVAADWTAAKLEDEISRELDKTVRLYTFEEASDGK